MKDQLHLQLAKSTDKDALLLMLQTYLKELGITKTYPYFDLYWTDQDRWPYLILIDEQIIGFSFVTTTSPFDNKVDFFLAEFYIDPAYRKSGYGLSAFQEITAKHHGQWELSFFDKNKPASGFWLNAIEETRAENIEILKAKNVTILRFSNN